MARASAETIAERIDILQRMLLEGSSNSVCVAHVSREWGVSRRQAYRLLKRAWQQIGDDVDQVQIDRRAMVSWCIHQLQSAAGLALQQKNSGAIVGVVRELDVLLGLGAGRNSRGQRRRA